MDGYKGETLARVSTGAVGKTVRMTRRSGGLQEKPDDGMVEDKEHAARHGVPKRGITEGIIWKNPREQDEEDLVMRGERQVTTR